MLLSLVPQNELPGPGTYGMGGVPHAAIEEKNKKSASTVGLFDASASSSKRSLPPVVSKKTAHSTDLFLLKSWSMFLQITE